MSDVEKILEASDGGLRIFEKIPGFKTKGNFLSPFREESTPSAQAGYKNGRWWISDHGGETGVDVFQYAQIKYNCEGKNGFKEALEHLARELNISLEKKSTPVKYVRPQFKTPAEKEYDKMLKYFEGRGISKSTINHFGTYPTVAWNSVTKQNQLGIVFIYTKDGELCNNRVRLKFKNTEGKEKKTILQEADAEQTLFGLDQAAGKRIWVWVEGEIDVHSVYEAIMRSPQLKDNYKLLFRKDLPSFIEDIGVVSLPNGSGDKLTAITNCIDWLDQVEEHIIFTDDDIQGEKLRANLCHRLATLKVKVVNTYHGCNDANEILCTRNATYLLNSIATAAYLPIEHVYTIADTKEDTLDFVTGRTKLTEPLGWELDKIWRPMPGVVTCVSGIPESGKSALVANMTAKAQLKYGYPIFVYGAEEPRAIKQARYIATTFGTPYIPGSPEHIECFNEQGFSEATDAIDGSVYWLEPKENADVVELEVKIKEAHRKYGIGIAVIDPYTHVESAKGNDRKETVRELLTMANRVAQELNIHIIIVAHPTKMEEEGHGGDKVWKKVQMYNISESANWANGCAFIIGTYRDYTSDIGGTEIYSMKLKFPFDGMKKTSIHAQFNVATNRFFGLGADVKKGFYRPMWEETLGYLGKGFVPELSLSKKVKDYIQYIRNRDNNAIPVVESVSPSPIVKDTSIFNYEGSLPLSDEEPPF